MGFSSTKPIFMYRRIIVIISLIFAVSASKAQQIQKVKITDVVKLMDTSTVPTIISFWASWCKPCVHEIPYFESHVKKMAHKNVRLILVSVDFKSDYPKKLKDFVKLNGYTSTILWLDETDADYFCPKIDAAWSGTIPATIMINNKTGFRAFFGEQIPEPRFILELDKLVKE